MTTNIMLILQKSKGSIYHIFFHDRYIPSLSLKKLELNLVQRIAFLYVFFCTPKNCLI